MIRTSSCVRSSPRYSVFATTISDFLGRSSRVYGDRKAARVSGQYFVVGLWRDDEKTCVAIDVHRIESDWTHWRTVWTLRRDKSPRQNAHTQHEDRQDSRTHKASTHAEEQSSCLMRLRH